MNTIDIRELQKRNPSTPSSLEKTLGDGVSPEKKIDFGSIKELVQDLYEQNVKVNRFCIVKKTTDPMQSPYCLSITKKTIELKEGLSESGKIVRCNLNDGTFTVNSHTKGAEYLEVFSRYIRKIFQDLADNKAELYEEAA